MIVYRLTESKFADSLDGIGAKMYGGRWNSEGIAMLYCTQYISLAVLEIVVKTSIANIPSGYSLLKIEVPDKMSVTTLQNNKLKTGWKKDIGYSRYIGDSFIKSGNSPVLRTPSAIIEEENNLLFNPSHPDFKLLKIISHSHFDFDKRLFLKNE